MYKCECGKQFNNPQAFNGHKCHCDIHLSACNKSEKKKEHYLKISETVRNTVNEKNQLKRLEELTKWVSEQHTCEKCGKIMIEKFGSGRYCSRACANSRIQTEEQNKNRRVKLKGKKVFNSKGYLRTEKVKNDYYKNPKICPVCGKVLEFENRLKKLCSTNCLSQYRHEIALRNEHGNYGGFISKNKKKPYKDIKLDSSYEVTVAKELDENNIKWIRPKSFFYIIKGKKHKYTPDFYLPEYDVYLDPKNDYLINNINPSLGYNDVEKINQVCIQNNIKVIILDYNNLKWSSILDKIHCIL